LYSFRVPHKKAKTKNRIIPYDQLLEKYEKQKMLLSRKRANISRLKKQLNNKHKNDKLNAKLFIKKTKFVSKNSKSLVTMQILHKKRRPWLQNEKKLAISIFYKSPAAYKFMRKNNIILPGVMYITYMAQSSTIYTWFYSRVYDSIKNDVQNYFFTRKKMCCDGRRNVNKIFIRIQQIIRHDRRL